jgi:hypothetical protein
MDAFNQLLDLGIKLAMQAGLGAVIFIFGLHRGWWVMGSQHKESKAHCEKWEQVATLNAKVGDTALSIAEKKSAA